MQPTWPRTFVTLSTLAGALLLSGCALYRNDKCWTPPEQYAIARGLFIQTGSMDIVRQRLIDLEWRTCRVNETMYRLEKEFEVLPEEVPRSSAVNPLATPTPTPAPAPSLQ